MGKDGFLGRRYRLCRCIALTAVLLVAACGEERSAPRLVLTDDLSRLVQHRHGHELVACNGSLYCLGGYRAREPLRNGEIWRWDGPRAGWRQQPGAMPTASSFFGAAVIGDSIYYVDNAIWRYRMDRAAVEQVAIAPEARLPHSHHDVAAFADRLWILGGYPAETSSFQVFDPADLSLRPAPPPPDFTPTDHLHVLAVLGGRLHVVGGITEEGNGLSDQHAAFDGVTWVRRRAPPHRVSRKFHIHGVHDGHLYVFDHEHGMVYEPESDRWRDDLAPAPHHIVMSHTISAKEGLYALGGFTVRGDRRYAAMRYRPDEDRWDVLMVKP